MTVVTIGMKKIKCLDCDKEFEGESKEEVLSKMHPHYMTDHKDVMEQGNEEKKKEWFEVFNKRWEEAGDL